MEKSQPTKASGELWTLCLLIVTCTKGPGSFSSYNFSGFNTPFEAILSVLQREWRYLRSLAQTPKNHVFMVKLKKKTQNVLLSNRALFRLSWTFNE